MCALDHMPSHLHQADNGTRNRYVSDGVIKWKEVEKDVPQASKNSWNSASVLHERKHLEKKIRNNEHGMPRSKSYAMLFILRWICFV